MAHALPADLALFPRYLRAITARLDRAIANPKKDADKLAPLLPVWTRLLQKRKTAADPSEAFEALLMFEELRVATFAPELKPAYPVSLQKVAAAVVAPGRPDPTCVRKWDTPSDFETLGGAPRRWDRVLMGPGSLARRVPCRAA